MPLDFVKPERISLKEHPSFSEKWVQQRIIDDPTLHGLGDVVVIAAEKIQPKASRLDLSPYDEQINRRYEVELTLGATDPSHIIRSIEYWDIECRRYPAYDHKRMLGGGRSVRDLGGFPEHARHVGGRWANTNAAEPGRRLKVVQAAGHGSVSKAVLDSASDATGVSG